MTYWSGAQVPLEESHVILDGLAHEQQVVLDSLKFKKEALAALDEDRASDAVRRRYTYRRTY